MDKDKKVLFASIIGTIIFFLLLAIVKIVLLGIIAFILIYFIPSFIASDKKIRNQVFALNLLLGWTFLGWVIALIWSLKNE